MSLRSLTHMWNLTFALLSSITKDLGEFNFRESWSHIVHPQGLRAMGLGLGFADSITALVWEKAVFEMQIQKQRGFSRVDEINVSVFRFSQGATEARAFCQLICGFSKVQTSGTSLLFDGVPLNIKFLGP